MFADILMTKSFFGSNSYIFGMTIFCWIFILFCFSRSISRSRLLYGSSNISINCYVYNHLKFAGVSCNIYTVLIIFQYSWFNSLMGFLPRLDLRILSKMTLIICSTYYYLFYLLSVELCDHTTSTIFVSRITFKLLTHTLIHLINTNKITYYFLFQLE
jgi:hypothetical protein